MEIAERCKLGGDRVATWRALVLAALLGVGCASEFDRREGPGGPYLEHKKLGYFISEVPEWTAGAWTRTKVPGADLAYRNDEGTAISLASRCRRTRASVGSLARQLTIGTSRERLLAAGPIEHGGDDGWTQTFDTQEDGVSLRIKAITLRAGACVYDWLLVTPGPAPFERAEPSFDRWMQSFVAPRSTRGQALPVPEVAAVPTEGDDVIASPAGPSPDASGEDAP
jgi:hypothetical protein